LALQAQHTLEEESTIIAWSGGPGAVYHCRYNKPYTVLEVPCWCGENKDW